MIKFAVISPHAPILLPDIGSVEDRNKVGTTLQALEKLSKKIAKLKPDEIIISSPHEDWGFNVPLSLLAPNFQGRVEKYLTGAKSAGDCFNFGQKAAQNLDKNKTYALIASGDLSHVLREDGPYGFHSDGPKFDQELIQLIKKKDVAKILKLDDKYPQASDCGLPPIAFMLGLLKEYKIKPKILSYEGPFGVGYLVAEIL